MTDDKNELKLKKYERRVAYAMALGCDCAEPAEKLDMDYAMENIAQVKLLIKQKQKILLMLFIFSLQRG